MTEPAEQAKLKPYRTVNEIRATSSLGSLHTLVDTEDSPVCWICLDGAASDKPLYKPCKCPRYCHSSCIARWQLQSAGSRKETHCEFCQETLPDWKQVLTPSCGANAPAVMNVNFDGRTYSFEVTPGESGYKLFTEAIRNAFSLPDDSELNITFTCDEPSTGTAHQSAPCETPAAGALLTLQGAGAYDAAVHCASVSAARRISLQPHLTVPADPARHLPSSSTTTSSASSTTSQQQQQSQAQQQAQQGAQQQGAQQERRPVQAQHSGSALAGKPRRMAVLGRKLRTALCDLLALK